MSHCLSYAPLLQEANKGIKANQLKSTTNSSFMHIINPNSSGIQNNAQFEDNIRDRQKLMSNHQHPSPSAYNQVDVIQMSNQSQQKMIKPFSNNSELYQAQQGTKHSTLIRTDQGELRNQSSPDKFHRKRNCDSQKRFVKQFQYSPDINYNLMYQKNELENKIKNIIGYRDKNVSVMNNQLQNNSSLLEPQISLTKIEFDKQQCNFIQNPIIYNNGSYCSHPLNNKRVIIKQQNNYFYHVAQKQDIKQLKVLNSQYKLQQCKSQDKRDSQQNKAIPYQKNSLMERLNPEEIDIFGPDQVRWPKYQIETDIKILNQQQQYLEYKPEQIIYNNENPQNQVSCQPLIALKQSQNQQNQDFNYQHQQLLQQQQFQQLLPQSQRKDNYRVKTTNQQKIQSLINECNKYWQPNQDPKQFQKNRRNQYKQKLPTSSMLNEIQKDQSPTKTNKIQNLENSEVTVKSYNQLSHAELSDESDISIDIDDCEQEESFDGGNGEANLESQKSNIVQLLKSVYEGRPSTIFFPYPACCEQTRDATRCVPLTPQEVQRFDLRYKILTSGRPFHCVANAFNAAGFQIINGENQAIIQNQSSTTNQFNVDWNVVWGCGRTKRIKKMNKFKKTNHFPGRWNLGRKDMLWKHLSSQKRHFPKDYNFIPNTYLLAHDADWERFLTKQKMAEKDHLWIMKPVASSRGRGVKMICKKSKISKRQNYLICEYITNPHLINGLKYDLRIYVLVSCYDPLRIYLYNEGLTRFATEKYTTSTKELSKRYIHLTNFSVNKHAANYVYNQGTNSDQTGSKWSLQALRKKYKELGLNFEEVWVKIKSLIIKTCISVEPYMMSKVQRQEEHRSNCFELYGFDVLIDDSLNPWLLEVNVCPALSSTSPLDRKIKHSLISDILNLIGIYPYDKQELQEQQYQQQLQQSITNQTNYSLSKEQQLTQQHSQSSSPQKSSGYQPNKRQYIQLQGGNQQYLPQQTWISSQQGNSCGVVTPDNYKKILFKSINDVVDVNIDNCINKLSPQDWNILLETDEEYYRRGNFERIFPTTDRTTSKYLQYFQFQRYNNQLLATWSDSTGLLL